MKKLNLFIIAVAVYFASPIISTLAQTTTVQYGPVLKDQGKTHTAEILGSDKNGYYTLRSDLTVLKFITNGTVKISLENYNNQNELVYSKPLPLPLGANGKPINFEQILKVQDQFILFSSKLKDSKDKYALLASRLNTKGEVIGKPVEVAVSEQKTKKQYAFFKMATSPDNSKILIVENLKTGEAPEGKYQVKILDNNLKEIYSKTISHPLPSLSVKLAEPLIDNFGNIYLYHATYSMYPNMEIKDPVNRFLVYQPSIDKVKEFDVAIAGKTISDLAYSFNKNQQLVIAGMYANNHPLDRSGTFFMRIDPSEQKIQGVNTKAFSQELLAEFKNRTSSKKENNGIAHMKLNKLILLEDGSAVLAAEQASWYQVNFTDGSGRSRGTVYHYESNDILVSKINPDGQTAWVARVPKLQHTLDDDGDFNGYAIGTNKDEVFVVYNDHAKNLDKNDPAQLKVMKNTSDAIPMLASIDNAGKVQKKALELPKDKNIPLQPTYFLNNDNGLIIYGKSDNNYRFGKVLYN